MKLAASKIQTYLKGAPAPLSLVYGENSSQTRALTQKIVTHFLDENAAEEMRLTRLDAKDAAKDEALLSDATRATSFFAGAKAVEIYDASDALAASLEGVLQDWQDGDALIFVQAGNLKKQSKLRKAFENSQQAMVIALYDDPLTPAEAENMVKARNLRLSAEAMDALKAFSLTYDKAAFEQFLGNLVLYAGQENAELTLADVNALLPLQSSAAEDEIINAMFRGDAGKLVRELRLAPAHGITLQALNMRAIWRAQMLFRLFASGNPAQSINTLRPPIFGARRQAIEENIRRWKAGNLETALKTLLEAEKEMRSGRVFLPEHAYLERIFLRVAMLAR